MRKLTVRLQRFWAGELARLPEAQRPVVLATLTNHYGEDAVKKVLAGLSSDQAAD